MIARTIVIGNNNIGWPKVPCPTSPLKKCCDAGDERKYSGKKPQPTPPPPKKKCFPVRQCPVPMFLVPVIRYMKHNRTEIIESVHCSKSSFTPWRYNKCVICNQFSSVAIPLCPSLFSSSYRFVILYYT